MEQFRLPVSWKALLRGKVDSWEVYRSLKRGPVCLEVRFEDEEIIAKWYIDTDEDVVEIAVQRFMEKEAEEKQNRHDAEELLNE